MKKRHEVGTEEDYDLRRGRIESGAAKARHQGETGVWRLCWRQRGKEKAGQEDD